MNTFKLHYSKGLSLIELMVCLGLSSGRTLGIISLISSTSRSFFVQDDFARLQENGMSALRFMGENLRLAGFYGMAPSTTDATWSPNVMTTGDCSGNVTINGNAVSWSLDVTTPLFGLNGLTAATVTARLSCIRSANFADSPIIVARGGRGIIINRDATGNPIDISSNRLNANTIYLQSDSNKILLFYGSEFDNLKATGVSRKTLNTAGVLVDAPIYEYFSNVYYIRPWTHPTGAGSTCRATDDNGRPLPSLVRQELIGVSAPTPLMEQTLAEGIEKIAISYGIDDVPANGDGVADRYTSTPTATEWPQVVGVHIDVLARSSSPISGHDDSTNQYKLVDGSTFNCSVNSAPCNVRRHVFGETIQLRNLAQRRGT